MKIIVDAMGGDNAPLEIVRGALAANRDHGVEIILVGRTAEVLKAVEACGEKSLRLRAKRLARSMRLRPVWFRPMK